MEQLTFDMEEVTNYFFFSVAFVGAMYDVLIDCGWTIEEACRVTSPFHLEFVEFDDPLPTFSIPV